MDKSVGPTTNLTFLGLGIDSVKQVIFIPEDKSLELKEKLKHLQSRSKVTLAELQSLCGSLNFFAKAIPGSRAFIRRFYNASRGIKKSHHFIRVTQNLKADAMIWLEFLDHFNGFTPFPSLVWSDNESLSLFTDSCGSCGGGAFFNKSWSYIAWPDSMSLEVRRDITYLELFPILMALWIWRDKFTSRKLLLNTDNMALVHILNSMSSKSPRVMSLIRPIVFICLNNNIQIKCLHIPGYKNSIADSISRFQWERFRNLAPEADKCPVPIPNSLYHLLSLK